MKIVMSLFLGLLVFTASCDIEKEDRRKKVDINIPNIDKQELTDIEKVNLKKKDPKLGLTESADVSEEVSAKIAAEYLDRYPELTVSLAVKNIYKTIKLIEGAGGSIVYNPNLGNGGTIPFLVVNIPPRKLIDKKFIKSLDLKAISVDLPGGSRIRPMSDDLPNLNDSQLYIPIEDIKVDKLREQAPGKGLGEGVRIAVIDTGVDASHPAFGDRVVFWSDETQEGRIPMRNHGVKLITSSEDNEVHAAVQPVVSFDKKVIEIPAGLDHEKPVYLGILDEAAMGAQVSPASKNKGKEGLDVDNNGSVKDKNIILAGQNKEGDYVAYFDFDNSYSFDDSEMKRPIIDFNQYRAKQRAGEDVKPFSKFLRFPSSNNSVAYPLIFEKDSSGNLSYLTVGMDLNSHGTHVSGIAAGDGARIKGAAPKAEIMALKVCSGITCTDSAIIRGLIKAFYNDQNLVPDVVNISLGSQQGYREGFYDILIRDLSAKFGATFFISASNSGPGHRSLNSLGSLSPAVLVGAHVSRNTLIKHYGFNPDQELQENQQLFFSSVGPSYTGEQRPNITAPGSALSAVPIRSTGAGMYNGTSMSSPIAAGSAAALLSLLKTDESYKWYGELKAEKIASLKPGADRENYSLIHFPLMFRAALEDSATKKDFKHYSQVQIGHGLIDINSAYITMAERLGELKSPEGSETPYSHYFFNAKVNDNGKANRLYNRGEIDVARAKTIKIGVNSDGEMSKAALESIQTAEIEVVLSQVEVQDHLGHVYTYDLGQRHPLPFSIANTKSDGRSLKGSVVINNRRREAFTSVRNRKVMEAGKVYTAKYDLFLQGHRVLTVLDTVHVPLELTQVTEEVYLPSIDHKINKKTYAYAVGSQEIKASTTHRYPVSLRKSDSEISLTLGIAPDANGRLLIQVYDPDGEEVSGAVAYKSPEIPSDRSVVNLKVPTVKKQGIYEITVSAYSGSFLVDSKYDLLVEAVKFRPSVTKLELAVGTKQVFAVANPTTKYSAASATTTKVEQVVSIKGVELIPNHRTFKKINFPEGVKEKLSSLTLRLDHRNDEKKTKNWLGRIDHRLYTIKDGKPTVLAKAKPSSSNVNQTFTNVSTKEPVFMAAESFNIIPEDRPISEAFQNIDFEAVIGTAQEAVTVTKLPQSSDDVYLFQVASPAKFKNAGYELRTTVKVSSNDVSVSIPVAVVPPK